MTVKNTIIELLNEVIAIFEPVFSLLIAMCVYLIVNPNGLMNVVWDANEPITYASLIGNGLSIYVLFRMAELMNPYEAIPRFSSKIYHYIKPRFLSYLVSFVVSYVVFFSWVYFMGFPPYQLQSSLVVALFSSIVTTLGSGHLIFRYSYPTETQE